MATIRRKIKRRKKAKTEVRRTVRIKAMDPVALCGKGTTVTRLLRVEERLDSVRIHHLVFLDRHGWYCEHGQHCGAVKDAQRFTRKNFSD